MGYYDKTFSSFAGTCESAHEKVLTRVSPVSVLGPRLCSPAIGRWASRDPIGEEGGNNLYIFIQNTPGDSMDYLGLRLTCETTTEFVTSKIIIQETASFEEGFVEQLIDYYQFTEERLIFVTPGGFLYLEVPTEYICKCMCAKRLVHRKRKVSCTKLRDKTTCTDDCALSNPLISTSEYWAPPEYGSPSRDRKSVV